MSTPRRRDGEGTLPKQRADGRWFSDIRSTDDYGVTKRTRVYLDDDYQATPVGLLPSGCTPPF